MAAAQYRIGEDWARDRITVIQEHAATAISERAVAALAVRTRGSARPTLGRLTVACVEGEWHALPARLVAQVMALHGWHVTFLGAHVPTRNSWTTCAPSGPTR
ncbi:B12-binding domain-containing protein [Streptomyces sp. M19]